MSLWFEDYLIKNFGAALMGADFTRMTFTPFVIPNVFVSTNMFPDRPGVAPDAIDYIVTYSKPEKRRLFIVTDEYSARFCNKITRAFERRYQFKTQVWKGAMPEAPLDSIQECVGLVNKFEPDLIMAVGGGSVIDTSKIVWLLYERPDMQDFTSTINPIFPVGIRKKAHLIAVPTTSGTGSECTPTSVVTDTETNRKIPVNHQELIPDYALLDPTLPVAMPPNLTAGTGMDVLAHAVDAVLCPAANDLTDAIGLRAIQMVFKYLPRAYCDGKDREARYRMHLASSMGGMVLSQAGSGISHAMGHAFGGVFHVHHGVTVGLFLPYEIQAYAYVSDKYLEICDALDVRVKDDRKSLANLTDKIRALMKEVDIPLSIEEAGVSKQEFEEKLDKMADYAAADPTSVIPPPYLLTVDQFKKLYRLAYTGVDLDLGSEF